MASVTADPSAAGEAKSAALDNRSSGDEIARAVKIGVVVGVRPEQPHDQRHIAPGFIRSAMTDVLPEAQKAALLGRIPIGDLGTGEDIAAATIYLASREAGYVTGQTLHVNGGMAMI